MPDLWDNRFAVAARYNDALAEEWGDEVFERLGVAVDEVMPVAVQRALRAQLIFSGRREELRAAHASGKPFHRFALSPRDHQMIDNYTAAVLDGILIGLRVGDDDE